MGGSRYFHFLVWSSEGLVDLLIGLNQHWANESLRAGIAIGDALYGFVAEAFTLANNRSHQCETYPHHKHQNCDYNALQSHPVHSHLLNWSNTKYFTLQS